MVPFWVEQFRPFGVMLFWYVCSGKIPKIKKKLVFLKSLHIFSDFITLVKPKHVWHCLLYIPIFCFRTFILRQICVNHASLQIVFSALLILQDGTKFYLSVCPQNVVCSCIPSCWNGLWLINVNVPRACSFGSVCVLSFESATFTGGCYPVSLGFCLWGLKLGKE